MHCNEKKIIFVHIPKNAGTSLSSILNGPNQFLIDKPWSVYKHYYSNYWEEYTTFSVIRNPISRFKSLYKYIRMNNWMNESLSKHCSIKTDINEFTEIVFDNYKNITTPIISSQSYFICDKDNNIKVDTLIRYENLDEDLKEIGIKNIPKLNQSYVENDDLIKLNDDSIFIIKKIYQKDFENFEYF